MAKIENVAKGLATYSGRDSVIRVTAYMTLFVYGITQLLVERVERRESSPLHFLLYLVSIDSLKHVSVSCRIVSKHFATTRLIMRFFDDTPALYNLYKYINSLRSAAPVVKAAVKVKLDENNNPVGGSSDNTQSAAKPKVSCQTTLLLSFLCYRPIPLAFRVQYMSSRLLAFFANFQSPEFHRR